MARPGPDKWRQGGAGDADWGMDPDEIAILLFTSGTTESDNLALAGVLRAAGVSEALGMPARMAK